MVKTEELQTILARTFQDNLGNKITAALANGMISEIVANYQQSIMMASKENKIEEKQNDNDNG